MGAPKKADWREERRVCVWERKQAGWSQKEIAEGLGVIEGAVSQWMKGAREGGEEALKAHPAPGAMPRLCAEQHVHLPAVLAKRASADGCVGEVWNRRRLAVVIKREFGVSSHPDHGGYRVRQMGDSMQKPVTWATQRNENAIKHWKTHQWPRLKKSVGERVAISKQPTIVLQALPEKPRDGVENENDPVARSTEREHACTPLARDLALFVANVLRGAEYHVAEFATIHHTPHNCQSAAPSSSRSCVHRCGDTGLESRECSVPDHGWCEERFFCRNSTSHGAADG